MPFTDILDRLRLGASAELNFTKPSFACQHPEWWTAPDATSTECEVLFFLYALVVVLQPEFIVETGSYHGYGTMAMASALHRNGHGKMVSLEIDSEAAKIARERCTGLPVSILTLSSLDYTPPEDIDFVWFDSLADLRPKEFLRFYPHLKSVVAFHDTGPQHTLRPHLDELMASGYIRPVYLPTPRGLCLAEVLHR
jgi:hypothetical protein